MESRKSKIQNGEETPCLPEQLITEEILPRLPAKSLSKFRCVSKPWCSLIGSKRFSKAHLKYSMKSSWIAQRCLFFGYDNKELEQCGLPSLFDKPITAPISHISDLGIDKSVNIIPVGFCNGLVCLLLDWKRLILLNPTTKKFRNLPDPLQGKRGYIGTLGFGFDELSDDYKVFGMVNLECPPPNCHGMVYSLSNDSWKPIDNSNHISSINGEDVGMYMSGKLHWKSDIREIVSFDLNSHVFADVELPSYVKGVLHSVGVIGGCLSAHFFHPNGDLDVWVMKEYMVKESWNKVVTVPYYDRVKTQEWFYHDIPTPVAIAPNGEVFLLCYSAMVCYLVMVIYDPKCGVFRRPQITATGVVCFLGFYVEGLASVAPDAQ